MEEYDTATIRLEKDSLLPSVFAEINGAVLPFVIDTGARFSGICLTHVTALGFAKEDLIPRIPGEPSYIVGYLKLSYTMGTFENSIEFDVFDMGKDVNLLGLDILKIFCCVIDLDKGVLTFRDFVQFEFKELLTPELIVNIQGKDVEVEIDTGSEFFIRGTLAQAKELNLSLTKEDNYKAQGVGYTASIEYTARDFCIKACGRESWDGEYAVLPDETA